MDTNDEVKRIMKAVKREYFVKVGYTDPLFLNYNLRK
jgi:hypothetical protein